MMNNMFEYAHGLNIQDADTDHDGINDGDELNYWENRLAEIHRDWSEEQILNMSLNYTRNPDVDGDNITDGKEINGYEVKIITGWKSDGTPISEMRHISPSELDPLVPYANSTGVWTDTDGDGIPDVVEAMLSNTSYWRFLVVEYPLLWAQYSWAANYYDTIKKKENESAAKEWLRDQFNPLIVDHTPPIITKFKLTWIIVTDSNFPYVHLYAHVHVSVRDVGRIEWVNVTDKNNGEVWSNWVDATYFDGQHNFSASLLSDGVMGSVRINLTTYDHAGNYFYGEKKLDGLVNASLNALAALWGQFWAALVAVGKAVARAMDVIVEWIIDQINGLFSGVISTLSSMMASILTPLGESWDKFNSEGVIDKSLIREFVAGLERLIIITEAIVGSIMIILYILMGVTFSVSNILLSIIASVLYTTLFIVLERGEKPSGISPNMSISEILQYIIQQIKNQEIIHKLKNGDNALSYLLVLFSFLLSGISWAISAAKSDVTGTYAGMLAAAIAFIAIIFTNLEIAYHAPYNNLCLGLSIIGIVVSLIGIGLAVKMQNGVALLIAFMSLIVSISALIFSS